MKYEAEWATGCYQCSYGLLEAPSLERSSPAYHMRLGQFQRGELKFCTCRAGLAYEKYLTDMRDKLLKEAADTPMMARAAAKGTHPELERAYGQRGYWDSNDE